MPAGWMHAVVDLIAYGESHLDLHQEKDRPWRQLGRAHRAVNHEWYHAYAAGLWSMDEPQPPWLADAIDALGTDCGDEAAERYMVDLSHDYWDRVWDETTPERRLYIAGFLAWLLFRPDLLESSCGVDVRRGRVERLIDGRLRWELQPTIIGPYRALCQYVRKVIANDPALQRTIAAHEPPHEPL